MHRIILLVASLATLTTGAAETGGPAGTPPAGVPGTTPSAPVAPVDQTASSLFPLVLMGGLFALMYFFMIRPQQKQEKKRQEMISAIKSGTKVVTIGGLHGEVIAVGEQTVDLRVGESDKQSVVMTFNKTAIAANLSAATA